MTLLHPLFYVRSGASAVRFMKSTRETTRTVKLVGEQEATLFRRVRDAIEMSEAFGLAPFHIALASTTLTIEPPKLRKS